MFSIDSNNPKRKTVYVYAWTLIVCLVTTFTANAGQPTPHISSLNYTVKGLFFYESGKGLPPKKDRIYNTVFNKADTRYINWELRIKYPKQSEKITFPIHYKYYDPQGKILTDYHINSYVKAGWNNSNHSGGYTTTWTPGTHRVDVFFAGKKVVSATFEVVSGKAGKGKTGTPTGKLDANTDIPDDLGEL